MNGFTHTKATTSSELRDEQKRTSELRISWFETLTMRGGYYVFCVNLFWKENERRKQESASQNELWFYNHEIRYRIICIYSYDVLYGCNEIIRNFWELYRSKR